MARSIRVIAALGFALTPLGACTSKGDGDEARPRKAVERDESAPSEPTSALGQAARDFVETRDRVVATMDATLVELDAKITSLEGDISSRAAEGKAAATTALAEALTRLEARRVAARAALAQAKAATEDRWDQLERDAEATLRNIDEAYQEAARELGR